MLTFSVHPYGVGPQFLHDQNKEKKIHTLKHLLTVLIISKIIKSI